MKNILLLLLLGGALPLSAQFDFTNAAQALGIVDSVGTSKWGAAVSFADFNGDGWDDLTIGTKAGQHPLFYRNESGTGYTLIDSLVDFPYEQKMILWVDYDNDGDKDLYMNAFEAPNRLFRNEGDLHLVDVTESAGLPLEDQLSWGAAFGDYNRDGWLDLYTVNRQIEDVTNYLYMNNGDGTFTDVTEVLGVSDGEQLTFCASFLDINQNLWPDLYLANDRIYGNTLFRNDSTEAFYDISNFSEAGLEIDAMNVGSGDFDNDGDLDIYVTNTPFGGNALLRNDGDGDFTNIGEDAGVAFFSTCWAGLFLDFDNDRDEDLYVCSEINMFEKANALYENLNDGTFDDLYPVGLPGDAVPSFSAAYGDYNQDGRLDLIVPNNGEELPKLWYNIFNNGYHWVKVRLEGVESNRDGIGVWIELWLEGQKYVRYTHCGDNYMTQNTLDHHLGMGDIDQIDSLVIRWPSGIEDVLYDIPGDSLYAIQEGSTEMVDTVNSIDRLPVLQSVGKIFPDPVREFFLLEMDLRKAAEVNFSIFDEQGREIDRWQNSLPEGSQLIEYSVTDYPPGVYFLRINGPAIWQIRRFVKLR